MSKSVDRLITTLEKESDIYDEILELSKTKRVAIRNQDMKKVEEIVSVEQGLVVSLFKLEEVREKVLDVILREYDMINVENISELMTYLPSNERLAVGTAKDRLLVIVKNVNDENKFNNRMLEERLELINLNLSLLTQMSDDSGKYNKNAVNEDGERKQLFDRRV